jgi:hypothetical protein
MYVPIFQAKPMRESVLELHMPLWIITRYPDDEFQGFGESNKATTPAVIMNRRESDSVKALTGVGSHPWSHDFGTLVERKEVLL